MTRIRLDPVDRKRQMTEAALVIVRGYGFKALTRVALAAETGTTDGLVNRYFGTRDKLRQAIAVEGVERRDVTIAARAVKDGYVLEGAPRDFMREVNRMVPTLA